MSAPQTKGGRNMAARRKKTSTTTAVSAKAIARTEKAIVTAFEKTHAGYSADRVVIDVNLDGQFVAACRDAGIPGSPRDWNLLLFRLRKAGRLAHIPTSRRTSIAWEECDAYLYASEIALAMLLESGRAGSLDEILCDPALAAEFDLIAARFAPGFDSLSYRWAALKLRKQAKLACSRRSDIGLPRFAKSIVPMEKFDPDDAPAAPGVYVVCNKAADRVLYVGESVNLRERLTRQFARGLHKTWTAAADGLVRGRLHIRTARSTPTLGMLAWQSYFVTKYRRPPLNFRDLQATT
jgi:site-specific DNA-methyltransferase (adenine-specific)